MQKTGDVQKEQKIIHKGKIHPRLNRLSPADSINGSLSRLQDPDHQAVRDANDRLAGTLYPAGSKTSLPGAKGFIPLPAQTDRSVCHLQKGLPAPEGQGNLLRLLSGQG
jgi:hypothetical protein